MSWKNVKEHYRIGHMVCVTDEGICIGSPYIHNIIVIGLDGQFKKRHSGNSNEDLTRYQAEMDADMATLKRLINEPDEFGVSLTVWTYDGGKLVEKLCEKPGWPNVTHDGMTMYDNTFSTDKKKVAEWAKRDARSGIEWRTTRVLELVRQADELAKGIEDCKNNLQKLEEEYP